jgi:hypothetical protein
MLLRPQTLYMPVALLVGTLIGKALKRLMEHMGVTEAGLWATPD